MKWRCRLFGHATVRDRREHDGLRNVLGFVCTYCGHWAPALERSREERARLQRDGHVRRLKVKLGQTTLRRVK